MMSSGKSTRHVYETATAVFALLLVAIGSGDARAQGHSLFNSGLPAGEIGRIQVARRPELSNVFQPVLLKVPEGATVSVAEGLGFGVNDINASLVSLQVGETYRMRVSNIPNQYGDVYPSIELIDRMHAPPGKETRYPIPIDITAEELSMAMSGKYVTRVIYVEDPRRALGIRDTPDQRYFEVMAQEDPFTVASSLGRPVAILRMGSLAPSFGGPSAGFLFGSPSIQRHAMLPTQIPYVPNKLNPSDSPASPIKRDALPDAPEQPDAKAFEETPPIPADLPERKTIEDEPDAGDGLFDESPSDDVLAPAGGDDIFDDAGDDTFDAGDAEENPFDEI